jgi:hypothetical protein
MMEVQKKQKEKKIINKSTLSKLDLWGQADVQQSNKNRSK